MESIIDTIGYCEKNLAPSLLKTEIISQLKNITNMGIETNDPQFNIFTPNDIPNFELKKNRLIQCINDRRKKIKNKIAILFKHIPNLKEYSKLKQDLKIIYNQADEITELFEKSGDLFCMKLTLLLGSTVIYCSQDEIVFFRPGYGGFCAGLAQIFSENKNIRLGILTKEIHNKYNLHQECKDFHIFTNPHIYTCNRLDLYTPSIILTILNKHLNCPIIIRFLDIKSLEFNVCSAKKTIKGYITFYNSNIGIFTFPNDKAFLSWLEFHLLINIQYETFIITCKQKLINLHEIRKKLQIKHYGFKNITFTINDQTAQQLKLKQDIIQILHDLILQYEGHNKYKTNYKQLHLYSTFLKLFPGNINIRNKINTLTKKLKKYTKNKIKNMNLLDLRAAYTTNLEECYEILQHLHRWCPENRIILNELLSIRKKLMFGTTLRNKKSVKQKTFEQLFSWVRERILSL